MRKLTLFCLAALAAPLFGQSLQEQADQVSVPAVIPHDGKTHKLEIPKIDGAEVSLFASDYWEVINKAGIVSPEASDVPVTVAFSVSKGGQTVVSRDFTIVVEGCKPEAGANAKPQVVPEILSWKGSKGTFRFGDTITVSKALPNKMQKALKEDLEEVTGKAVSTEETAPALKLVKESKLGVGSEGYQLDITAEGVTLRAQDDTGLYWGTRTLLQLLRQSPELPIGTARDFPRFGLRGFMLDCGRLPATIPFIKDLIRTMSWYKMNDLQLHLNDNYIFHENYVDSGRDPFKETYSAFRLESKVKGKDGTKLTAKDLAYSKKEFRDLIEFAKARGVRIVPEFDAPGHALSFTRVRPDLIYQGPMHGKEKRRCEMLDASKPETVAFVGKVFDEYLKPQAGSKKAVFDGCVVHIGADEFFGGAEDYRKYTDSMLKFIQSRGHTPRLWGSLTIKGGNTPVLSEGVQMNLWSEDWARAWQMVNLGYDVINTHDKDLYIVPFSNYYRADFNQQKLYSWLPNKVGSEMLPAGHPKLLGATYAIWNDMIDLKYRGYSAEDTWPSIVGMMEIFNQRLWGKAGEPMPFRDFRALVHRIGDAPGTNIGYRKGVTKIDCDKPAVNFNKPSVGPSYQVTAKLVLKSAKNAVLFSGDGATFYAADKEGNLAFRRADGIIISYNAKLPLNKECTLEIEATPGKTALKLDGRPIGKPSLPQFHHQDKDIISSFILPLQQVGSDKAEVKHLTVEPIDTPHTDCPQDIPADQRSNVEG